jgi:hypothetical protein
MALLAARLIEKANAILDPYAPAWFCGVERPVFY